MANQTGTPATEIKPVTAKSESAATAPAPTAPETAKMVRVSGNIPADLYDKLWNGHRFDARKEKGEYLAHIVSEFAKGLPTGTEKV